MDQVDCMTKDAQRNKLHMRQRYTLDAIAHYDSEVFTWGDGDSLDRERVRDIMNNVYDGKYNPFDYLEEKEVYA